MPRFVTISAMTGALRMLLLLAACGGLAPSAVAEDDPEDASTPRDTSMTLAGLQRFVESIDADFERRDSIWQFTLGERQMILVADRDADRMRLMTPIIRTQALTKELRHRLLQANFDTTLDARYAVANEVVWSTFIHPLSPLDSARLSDAALQVWTTAATFGTTFTSGSFHYRGGDSDEAIEKRRQELEEELDPTT